MKRHLTSLSSLLTTIMPTIAWAADTPPTATGSITQMLFGLGIVLALLYGALTFLRHLQQGHKALPGSLKVLSAASVGPRERVVMVAAGKRILVLGVAPGRVNMLHLMDEGEMPAMTETPAPGQDFAARLKQLMERRRRES